MDKRQWEALQFHAQNDRKRSWNPAFTTAEVDRVESGLGTDQEDYELSGWKRRRPTSQIQGGGGWETNVQTSLWLAQQNRLAPTASMSREEEGSQSFRTKESGQSYSGEDVLGLSSRPSWAEDRNLSDEQSLHAASTSAISCGYCGVHRCHGGCIARKDDHHPAAPRPRKPAIITGIEQRCEKCLHGELHLRDALSNLNKLAESLNSGSLYEITQSRQSGILHDQAPYVLDLHRILDLAQEANELAKQVVQFVPSYLQNAGIASPLNDRHAEGIQIEAMKRKFLNDSKDVLKRPRQPSENNLCLDPQDYSSGQESAIYSESPRRPSIIGPGGSDRLPPIRSHSPTQPLPDGFGITLPSMKPPPTPSRQLPSPPGRPHPSPPPYNVLSPTSIQYPLSASSTSAPLPSSALPSIHHPLSPTPSSSLGTTTTTGAVQAHTAALQHEVSVKKYALQTLQNEYNKLLATLRRSQTRARTLEEKQVTSDQEINALAEERVRLLAQIAELEQSVSDISKSRDDFRQATVKEGAQYVKIVRMASRLEMMAGEERREWTRKLKESEEAKAQAYQKGLKAGQAAAAGSGTDNSEQAVRQTSPDKKLPDGPVENMKQEVQRLRVRCNNLESTLRNVRHEAQRVGEALAALGSAGEQILEDANGALIVAESSTGRKVS